MNIALLVEKYTPDVGGLAISAERLVRLLASAGHKIRVFCPSLSLSPSERQIYHSAGVAVVRFGAHKRVDDTLVDWFELVLEEHKHQPFDVLHAYFLNQAGFVAAYAGRYLGLPSVVSIRGNDIERAALDPGKFSHVIYALQNASAVTTNASVLAKKAKAFIDREVFLIPNGVDTDNFKPHERNDALANALGLDTKDRTIGFVGELREKKGLAVLLRAYAQVVKYQPATLLIVGDVRAGDDRKIFDELKSSIPNAKITVTGYVANHDLPSYYSVVNVFVHPSLRDGLPNSLLEAMACEKAMIATPVGGVLDVIQDGGNGRIVPINDVLSLSTVIQEVLSDKLLQRRLGMAARQTVLNKFTPQNELEGNRLVYSKLGLKT